MAKKFLRKAEDALRSHMKAVTQEVVNEANKSLPADRARFVSKEQKLGFDIELLMETLSNPYVAYAPQHLRRLPTKTVTVRAHTKTYKAGFMPVKSGDNTWYTVNINNYDFGKPLQDAWQKISRKYPDIELKGSTR